MGRTLGKLETQLLAYAQMRNLQTARVGELAGPLRLSRQQELKLLGRLARSGLIARVSRGLYLLPRRLPLGGKWSPGETLALNTLIADRGGRYQITGPNAFNRYGFDEQIPTRTYVYNNRLSGDRNVGSVSMTLIKVADERLGSVEEIQTADGLTAIYSSRTRTLVDAVYDWSRFDGLPRAYGWICRELEAARISAAGLVSDAIRFGNLATIRRVGVLLERQGVNGVLLGKLEKRLSRTTSAIPWVPTRPKRGKVNYRWGVVLNEEA